MMTVFFGAAAVIFYRGFINPPQPSVGSAPAAAVQINNVVGANPQQVRKNNQESLALLGNPLFADRISAGNFSPPDQQEIFVEHPDKLSPATGVEVFNVGTGEDVVLRWNDSQDSRAEQIAVYRSDTPETVGTRMTIVSLGTQVYRDTTVVLGSTYYYYVLPTNSKVSSPSVFPVAITIEDTIAPPPPEDVQVFVTESAYVRVTWRPSAAEVPSHYEIYRSREQGLLGDPIVVGYGSDKTSYEDTTVTPGLSYYYTVAAVDASGNKSTALTADPTVGNQFPFGR